MSDLGVWEKKLKETGDRVRRLLVAAAREDFEARVRDAFVAGAAEPEEVGSLKTATRQAADDATAALDAALDAVAWTRLQPGEGTVLAVPGVKPAIDGYDAALGEHFAHHDLGQPEPFALPARFIDGDNLVSLTRALWKAAEQRAAVLAQSEAAQEAASADVRRKLWDDA